MKIKKSELNKYEIRYTVELNNLNRGTITVVTYFSSNHTFASVQRIFNISYKTARLIII